MARDKYPLHLTIAEAREDLRAKKISALELTRAYLARIKERDPAIGAYLEVYRDAEAQARAADQKIAEGKEAPLLGIPIAVKDNILIEGKRVSAASRILESYVATYDATAIQKLKQAGAVFLGRTNMDEFAMGGTTEHSAWGPTHNPYDESRVPGGSSGGSAAAVASDQAIAALGSDTGGSVREPASFCGLVGLKPTYGAVSRSGLIAMGSSLDQIGPLTRSVADAVTLFDIMRGQDPRDSTTLPNYTYPQPKKKLIFGVPRHLLKEGIEADVSTAFEESLMKLKAAGHEIRDIELPNVSHSLAAYYIVMPAESSTNLARFDGVRYGLFKEGKSDIEDYEETRAAGFGKEVRRRIILGTYVLSHGYYDAYYKKAITLRALATRDHTKVYESGVDVIVTPTAPCPAVKIGEKHDPLSVYLLDIFTVTANLTGMPALSVPMGFVEREGKKLPVGIQYTAPHTREDLLFEAGKVLEQ